MKTKTAKTTDTTKPSKAELEAKANARIAKQDTTSAYTSEPKALFPRTENHVSSGDEADMGEPMLKPTPKPLTKAESIKIGKSRKETKLKNPGGPLGELYDALKKTSPKIVKVPAEKKDRCTKGKGPLCKKMFQDGKSVEETLAAVKSTYPNDGAGISTITKIFDRYTASAEKRAARKASKEAAKSSKTAAKSAPKAKSKTGNAKAPKAKTAKK